MWKSLVHEKFRETTGIAAVALVAYLFTVTGAMRIRLDPLPGLVDLVQQREYSSVFQCPFSDIFLMMASLLTITLGFRQSLT